MRGKIKDFHPAFKIPNFVIYPAIYIFTEDVIIIRIGFNLTGEFIGYVAAVCTTAAYVPQAVKVYKTQRTNDISMFMFVLISTGVLLWLAYGIIIASIPMIIANTITFVLSLYIFIMKIKLDYYNSD
jgi:MtN3 and saliva related transmembrane protein